MKFFIVLCAVALGYVIDRAFFHGKYFAAAGRLLAQMAAGFGFK